MAPWLTSAAMAGPRNGGDPVQLCLFEIVADAGLGEHAPVPGDRDVADRPPRHANPRWLLSTFGASLGVRGVVRAPECLEASVVLLGVDLSARQAVGERPLGIVTPAVSAVS